MNTLEQTNKKQQKQNVSFLLSCIYLAFFASGATSNLLGAILPDIKTAYNLNYVISGALITFHQVGNVIAVLVAGILPLIIGRKKTTCFLGISICLGLVGMTLTGNPFFLFLSFVLTGVGRGTSSTIANVVVAENVKNKTAGLNLLHATFAVGAIASPFLAIVLSSILGVQGWKFSCIIIGLVSFVAVVMLAFSSLSNTPVKKSNNSRGDFTSEKVVPFYKSVQYWLVTFILFFYLCSESAACGWLVTYFKDTGLMAGTVAKSSASLLWLTVLAGRLLCAKVSGRVNKNLLVLILCSLQIIFFVMMLKGGNIFVIMAGLLGMGFSMSGIYPTTLSTMKIEYSSSTLAIGISICVATLGAMGMPIIVGAVAQAFGIVAGVWSIIVALAVLFLLCVIKLTKRL